MKPLRGSVKGSVLYGFTRVRSRRASKPFMDSIRDLYRALQGF